ncbi:hypothetical protein EJ08DRAFT_611676, partial [Tothia fuscella]
MTFIATSSSLKHVAMLTSTLRSNSVCYARPITRIRMHSTVLPIIRKQLDNNTEEDISEEELFRYSRHRWLTFDEDDKLASRYRKFNVAALVEAAATAVGDGTKSCVKILKCIEGSCNKALLLTMDDGTEVLAKLPNPNAGPSFYTTASQVATHQFLREILDLPVPRIYAYSADSSNAVGAEYIIEDKAAGQPLSDVWYSWSEESQTRLVSQLVDIETKLASLSFRSHGCLYYKKDLVQRGIPVRHFYAPLLHPTSLKCDHISLQEYTIGPSVTAALWEDERATMESLDRGPWWNPLAYMKSIVTNEKLWAENHAVPRSNSYGPTNGIQSPQGYISLLERYLQLMPYMAPAPTPMTLFHPDLHMDNIFVDPETKKIACIIDWQTTLIAEPYFQPNYPKMLTPIEPSPRDDKSDEENAMDHYQALTEQRSPQRWAQMNDSNHYLLTKVISSIPGSWTRDNGFGLCHNLIAATVNWEEVAPPGMPCPIHFTEEELESHNCDLQVAADLAGILEQLEQGSIIPNDGKVLADDYERALEASRKVKEWFVFRVESEKERDTNSKV